MHLKPTAGCQIPTLIFENKLCREKWVRTLPSLIYFYGVFIETPSPIFLQISKLIFDTLLWASDALSHIGT
jgi:hypothetical protein